VQRFHGAIPIDEAGDTPADSAMTGLNTVCFMELMY
jgi:hypothetical protein